MPLSAKTRFSQLWRILNHSVAILRAAFRANGILFVLCCVAFVLSYFSVVESEFSDPRGTLLLAQTILQQGSIRLDQYADTTFNLGYRVFVQGTHTYYFFPIGTSLLAIPFVWLANLYGYDMVRPADDYAVQNFLSALLAAIALFLIYRISRRYTDKKSALFLSTIFVFGTSIISTMGTALWSSDVSMILILCALLLLLQDSPSSWLYKSTPYLLGVLLFAAYLVRPSTVTFAAPVLLFWLTRSRSGFLKTVVTGGVCMAGFIIFSLFEFQHWLPPYYLPGRVARNSFFTVALFGNLFSPARGLLVYSPFLVITLLAVAIFFRRLYHQPLFWASTGWFVLHWLLISRFPHWWGGWSYGPRLFADAVPATLLFTLLVWRAVGHERRSWFHWGGLLAFITAAVFAVGINTFQGLYNPYTTVWNGIGTYNIDIYPDLLFDWKYPQFLATSRLIAQRNQFYRERGLIPNILQGRRIRPTKDLREWQPVEAVTSSDLAVILDAPSWYDYESDWGARWMRGKGRLWISVEQDTSVLFRMLPAAIGENGTIGKQGRLTIFVNGTRIATLNIRRDQISKVELPVRRGMNDVQLSLEAGEVHPAGDPRSLGIAFRLLEFHTEGTTVTVSDQLRQQTPAGFRSASQLALLLGDGWYEYEPDWQARWMRALGKLWIASPDSRISVLRFLPAAILQNATFVDRGEVHIRINGVDGSDIYVQSGKFTEVSLPLQVGVNEVQLELKAGETFVPDDPRPLAIAFHMIEVGVHAAGADQWMPAMASRELRVIACYPPE